MSIFRYILMPTYEEVFSQIPKSIRDVFPDPEGCKKPSLVQMHKKVAMTYILWLIEQEPMTGYQLMKLLKEHHHRAMATPSRIYPLLSRLEVAGLLRAKTLKKGKRESKQYSITGKGRLVIKTTRKIISRMLWGKFLQDISKR
ncbi:hypothetical protein GF415_04180 [Candidatus Micrarchaeota archaeon]|nr:hypothetical protein [Candidatus Micrarchaeota archaeon]